MPISRRFERERDCDWVRPGQIFRFDEKWPNGYATLVGTKIVREPLKFDHNHIVVVLAYVKNVPIDRTVVDMYLLTESTLGWYTRDADDRMEDLWEHMQRAHPSVKGFKESHCVTSSPATSSSTTPTPRTKKGSRRR